MVARCRREGVDGIWWRRVGADMSLGTELRVAPAGKFGDPARRGRRAAAFYYLRVAQEVEPGIAARYSKPPVNPFPNEMAWTFAGVGREEIVPAMGQFRCRSASTVPDCGGP
jgi:hypothetical protein